MFPHFAPTVWVFLFKLLQHRYVREFEFVLPLETGRWDPQRFISLDIAEGERRRASLASLGEFDSREFLKVQRSRQYSMMHMFAGITASIKVAKSGTIESRGPWSSRIRCVVHSRMPCEWVPQFPIYDDPQLARAEGKRAYRVGATGLPHWVDMNNPEFDNPEKWLCCQCKHIIGRYQ